MKKTIEDYLKTILLIRNREGQVRSIALAEAFGVSKPTVCKMVKSLILEGYILKDENKEITLTERGAALASQHRCCAFYRCTKSGTCNGVKRPQKRLLLHCYDSKKKSARFSGTFQMFWLPR